MKTHKTTLKDKKRLTQHFKQGGRIDNIPNELRGTPGSVLIECLQRVKPRQR